MINNFINDFIEKSYDIISEDENKNKINKIFILPLSKKVSDYILPYIILLLVVFIILLIFITIILYHILKKNY